MIHQGAITPKYGPGTSILNFFYIKLGTIIINKIKFYNTCEALSESKPPYLCRKVKRFLVYLGFCKGGYNCILN